MIRPIALALALTLPALPALAFDASNDAAIASVFDRLAADISSGNMAGTLDVMPPALLQQMATQVGVSTDQLKEMVATQAAQAMEQVKIEETTYDLDTAQKATSSAGRDYALIPTRTVMQMGSDRVEATGTTLALEDGGKWYLLRLDSPEHLAMIGQLYPDLAGLTAPPGAMRTLE